MTARVSAIVLAGGRSTRFGSDKLIAPVRGRPLLHWSVEAVAGIADDVLVLVPTDGPPPDLPALRTAGAAGAEAEADAVGAADAAAAAAAAVGAADARVRVIRDSDAFAGPLAGLRDGARAARHPILLVVGGDMPDLVPDVLTLLVREIEMGADASVLGDVSADESAPEVTSPPGAVLLDGSPDGSAPGAAPLRPLPMALARSPALAAMDALLGADRRSLRALLTVLPTAVIAPDVWRAYDPGAGTLRDVDVPGDLR